MWLTPSAALAPAPRPLAFGVAFDAFSRGAETGRGRAFPRAPTVGLGWCGLMHVRCATGPIYALVALRDAGASGARSQKPLASPESHDDGAAGVPLQDLACRRLARSGDVFEMW